MSEHISVEVFPVWDYIEEEMQARGWDRVELAHRMGGDEHERRINLLELDFLEACKLTGQVRLDKQTAAKLGRAFGTSAELWMNLDKSARAAIEAGRNYHSTTERTNHEHPPGDPVPRG